jgi:hypothetical protein
MTGATDFPRFRWVVEVYPKWRFPSRRDRRISET